LFGSVSPAAGRQTFERTLSVRFAKFIAASMFAASVLVLPTAAHAQEDAKLRVGHFSADTPSVDIYVDGKKTFAQVKFPLMSAYTPLASGSHTVDVRPAGGAATDPALVSLKADLAAGKNYLVSVVGPSSAVQAKLITDDLSAPAKGKARVRVLHGATGAPNVDVSVDGTTNLFSDVAFGTATPYAEVDATKYDLSVRESGKTVQLVGKRVALQEGGVYSIVAVANPDKSVTLRGFADVAPTGTPTPAGDPTGAADSTTTIAATPVTTVATPVTTTTVAAAAVTEVAVPDTEVAVPDTEVAVPDTEVAVPVTEPVAAVTEATTAAPSSTPVNGVDTGFGGLDGSSSTLATLGLGGLVAALLVRGVRRRASR
jgi:hypothetical protein